MLNGQPALVEHERKLREKITILCLMNLIFKCARCKATQSRFAMATVIAA